MSDIAATMIPELKTRLRPPKGGRGEFVKAVVDLFSGLVHWRIWATIATTDVRQRYQRSRLGQFWHTLLMLILVGSIGFVYFNLFNIPIHDYLPYLAITFPVWTFISGIVADSVGVFSNNSRFMSHMALPLSSYVYAMVLRNLILFAHNIVVIPVIFLVFQAPFSLTAWWSLLGIGAILVNGLWVGVLIGAVCARFRDVTQIVTSALQIAFFVTPVMYRPNGLSGGMTTFLQYNPFANFLASVRDPLLGKVPAPHVWMTIGVVTAVGYALMLVVFARSRRRIIFWI